MTAAADAARAALAAGVSVCPPREDGTKAPITTWKEFQTTPASLGQVEEWYANGRAGVGVICGEVSGGLEMLEMDTAEIMADYITAARAAGLHPLLSRVANGYYETTPHGHHLFYRIEGGVVPGNTKLARRPKHEEEKQHPQDNVQTLIETRGEGGFVVVAPSSGRVHPTGQPYILRRGGWDSIATITTEEREQLHDVARSFDVPLLATALPPLELQPTPLGGVNGPRSADPDPARRGSPDSFDLRPGDDYNARGSLEALLTKHGWTFLGRAADGNDQWRRPGKSDGVSATYKDGQFWSWTTSSTFEAERTYTLFGVYTVLEAGGDFAEATRRLSAEGYGSSGALRSAPGELPGPSKPATPAAPRNDGGWQPLPGLRPAVSLSDWLTKSKAGAA